MGRFYCRRHDRNRDRDRDFDHDDHRSYREKDRGRVDRDVRPNRDRYYDSYDDRRVAPRGGANQWRGATSGPPPPHSDAGYYGATSDMQHGGTGPYTNRYYLRCLIRVLLLLQLSPLGVCGSGGGRHRDAARSSVLDRGFSRCAVVV